MANLSFTRSAVVQYAKGRSELDWLIDEEKVIFQLANQERLKAGLPEFSLDPRLTELARIKSKELFKENYFSHISPVHGSALDMERKNGIAARVMGAENIAKATTPRRVHELFMGSEEHRGNILNNLHDTIGIGVYKSRYGIIATQLFTGH